MKQESLSQKVLCRKPAVLLLVLLLIRPHERAKNQRNNETKKQSNKETKKQRNKEAQKQRSAEAIKQRNKETMKQRNKETMKQIKILSVVLLVFIV